MPERQPLDPALRELLDEQADQTPDLTGAPDTVRVAAARQSLQHALKQRHGIAGLPNRVNIRKLTIAHDRPARLYRPTSADRQPQPLLVYLHGGGWVGGSLETHEPFCCLLSEASGVSILAVDYRQPPEHPFPAALEDSVAAVHWATVHAEELGADTLRLAVGGDSAGGNLAAATANRLAETPNAPTLHAQVLLYPVTDHPGAHHPSYQENATGYGLTAERMHWFWQQYAPGADPNNPELSVLRRAAMPPLPSTLLLTAEYDVLRDEGRLYADKLRAAGVAVTHRHAPDMNHNFPVGPATVARFPQSVAALNEIAGWMRAMLHTPLRGLLPRH